MSSSTFIGIDLGTSYSSAAVYKNGKVEVIPIDDENRRIASVVAFTDANILIGEEAKRQAGENSKNTVFNLKRLIGKKREDPSFPTENYFFPLKLKEGSRVAIEVEFERKRVSFSPEEIYAMILKKLKKSAEKYLGHDVEGAVISVPASSSNSQRVATLNAATIAGFAHVQLINEPTATAITYAFENNIETKENTLIVDIGGGSLDVSIISVDSEAKIEVLATNGDTDLGGIDFDKIVCENFLNDTEKNEKNKNYQRIFEFALQRYHDVWEETRIKLTNSEKSTYTFGKSTDNCRPLKMTRKTFEKSCDDLIRKIKETIDTALNDAKFGSESIDSFVFVGGMSTTPKIRYLLKSYCGEKRGKVFANFDETVVRGAAIQAAKLCKVRDEFVININGILELHAEPFAAKCSTMLIEQEIGELTKEEISQMTANLNALENNMKLPMTMANDKTKKKVSFIEKNSTSVKQIQEIKKNEGKSVEKESRDIVGKEKASGDTIKETDTRKKQKSRKQLNTMSIQNLEAQVGNDASGKEDIDKNNVKNVSFLVFVVTRVMNMTNYFLHMINRIDENQKILKQKKPDIDLESAVGKLENSNNSHQERRRDELNDKMMMLDEELQQKQEKPEVEERIQETESKRTVTNEEKFSAIKTTPVGISLGTKYCCVGVYQNEKMKPDEKIQQKQETPELEKPKQKTEPEGTVNNEAKFSAIKTTPVGISLGTKYCCVGVYQNGKFEIIQNECGNKTTPSVVTFSAKELFVGETASNQGVRSTENTIYNAKRFIGTRYSDDEKLQSDIDSVSFRVNKNGQRVCFGTQVAGRENMAPEEITAILLRNQKNLAENHLNSEVTDVVITVPASFNNSQRESTKDAAYIAGFKNIQLINEPTSAALAYGIENNIVDHKTVLVFNLGGGSFDVSIVRISQKSVIKVLSTFGDSHFGGEEFDQKLFSYFLKEFNTKHKTDMSRNLRARKKLRDSCEKVKKTLTHSKKAFVGIDSLHDGIEFNSTISRSKFEDLCSDLFGKISETVHKTLENAKKEGWKVDEVVIVGGGSRIPKIGELLETLFKEEMLKYSINREEAAVHGAAVKAANLENVKITDVVPFDIEIGEQNGRTCEPIKKNNPFNKIEVEIPRYGDRTRHLYEGNSSKSFRNNLLGTLSESDGETEPTLIKLQSSELSPGQVSEMKERIQKIFEDNKCHHELTKSKNQVEAYVIMIKRLIKENSTLFGRHEVLQTIEKINEAMELINSVEAKLTVDEILESLIKHCDEITRKVQNVA